MGMHNHRAVVAYDGTGYSGFQIQRDRRTIQGELEGALRRVTSSPTRVVAAGRTDGGVHAYGQVVSFHTDWRHGPEALQRALNAALPRDISVRDVEPVAESFHARYSARGRVYVYNLYSGPVRIPPLDRFALYVGHPVELGPMRQASASLLGQHDFAAFGQAPSGSNTVRRVDAAAWLEQEWPLDEGQALAHVARLRFRIEANAFLRGMVRRIVGTLLWVGSGRLRPAEFNAILRAADISRAGPPAKACGLSLWHVNYADGSQDLNT
ncbi:MAG: tRNA pseudouridine(38-40) synthase TruA [Anaerolineae bacterium]|nr:tRNA pseudouridine(38-40) synthase TruA [Anaerolineae bacterium]